MADNDDFLNLQHDVERHEGDLDKLADRTSTLEHDLRLILALPGSHIAGQISAYANQAANPNFDQKLVREYTDLAERYGLR